MPLAEALPTLTPATVTVAVERIVAACQPEAILAFGSRARGQARPDSDLDLCVLLPAPAAEDGGALRRRLRALLADMPFAKDILVTDAEAFARSRTQLNGVYQDIAATGFPLWEGAHLNPAAIARVCR